ncbi:hypothetical protein E2C01_069749 [Portunus trituberculatus]|uniref:Uncharacterized protein n=1 Tax=Portunus trituberculatus TaxID=210409 RepID=A0A5B7HZD8_PORTR|nr:hypothetical protein [Portunus trituberculatus]
MRILDMSQACDAVHLLMRHTCRLKDSWGGAPSSPHLTSPSVASSPVSLFSVSLCAKLSLSALRRLRFTALGRVSHMNKCCSVDIHGFFCRVCLSVTA